MAAVVASWVRYIEKIFVNVSFLYKRPMPIAVSI